MELWFKQRFFSWLDSYDIYDEAGEPVYTVEGKLAWGHKLVIYDARGEEVGMVREQLLRMMPHFTITIGGREVGEVRERFRLLRPAYEVDYRDWQVEGDIFGWEYAITDGAGRQVATISRRLSWTDTYVLEIVDPQDALSVLIVVLAIDAANCSHGS